MFFGGAGKRCMVDNTNVVVAYGTGPKAVIAPEMDFADIADANRQLRSWCETANGKPKETLHHSTPLAIFEGERPLLQPLPVWIPEVTRVEERRVDVERYVTLHTNRYSAPPSLIDQMVEVHETIRHVRVFHRHKLVAEHEAFEPGQERTSTLPEHKRAPGASKAPPQVGPEEADLIAAGPEFVAMIALMRTKYQGRALRPIRRLHTLFLEYPTEALREVLVNAVEHKVYDVVRIERLVLRAIGRDWFCLPTTLDDP